MIVVRGTETGVRPDIRTLRCQDDCRQSGDEGAIITVVEYVMEGSIIIVVMVPR